MSKEFGNCVGEESLARGGRSCIIITGYMHLKNISCSLRPHYAHKMPMIRAKFGRVPSITKSDTMYTCPHEHVYVD